MIILNGQSLTAAGWFRPESMGLNLEERKSTASLTLGPDGPALSVGQWLKDDEDPGAGIVWRIKAEDTQYNTETRTEQLEHIINTLRDAVMFGEVTPETITGTSGATSCTAKQAAQYILGRQSIWTLGDFEYENVSNPYSFNGETLFAALETVTGSLEDACWEYDMTAMPFKVHIRHISSTVSCEMREGRNIQTLQKTIDRSRMYTRFYPIGKNNMHITGDYVSRNENLYGMVAVIETDQSMDTEAKLLAWANERLSRHCEPAVTTRISGLELSEATGESLDRLQIGRKCQVPLPEFGTTITETIKKLSWRDKIKDRESVTVTLSNVLEDVASIINQMKAAGGGGGRAAAKEAEEDHAWFVDTTHHVAMVAEAVAGEGAAEDWSRVAQIVVDGEGIHQRVTRAEGYIVTLDGKIDMTEESLRVAFTNEIASTRNEILLTSESLRVAFTNGIASTRTAIEAEAGRIGLVVEGYGNNATVKRAAIFLAINGSGGSDAHIDAENVYIGNSKSTTVIAGKCALSDVTANYINSKIAELPTLNGIAASFTGNVSCAGLIASQVYVGSSAPYTNISDGIAAVRIDGPTNNVYKLQYKKFSDSSWQDASSFSKATLVSGSWSGAVYTAAPDANGAASASTTLILQIEGSATPNSTAYAMTYHDIANAQHELLSKTMTLAEDVANRQVTMTENSTVKAKVSTQSTYNAALPASAAFDSQNNHNDNLYNIVVTSADGTPTTLIQGLDASAAVSYGMFKYRSSAYWDNEVTYDTTLNPPGWVITRPNASASAADTYIVDATAPYAAGRLSRNIDHIDGGMFYTDTLTGSMTIYFNDGNSTTYIVQFQQYT